MKVCKNCGSQIPDEVRFCPNCGTPIEAQTVNNKNVKKKSWICSSLIILFCGFFGVVWLPLEILAILLFVLRLSKRIGNIIWNIILACIIGFFLICGLLGDETDVSQTNTSEIIESTGVSEEEISEPSIGEGTENAAVPEVEESTVEIQETEAVDSTEEIETQYIRPLLEWEYPSTFKKQRKEVFDLMLDAEGKMVEDEAGNIMEPFCTVDVRNDIVQKVNSAEWSNYYYYYGNMKDDLPDGAGVLLTKVIPSGDKILFLPVYAGYFQEGTADGYGIKFRGDRGVEMEGEFSKESLDGGFESIMPTGKVIYYYENNINEIAVNNSTLRDEIDYYSHMQFVNRSAVFNYPALQPSVYREGEYQGDRLNGDIKEYYNNYQFNSNDQMYHKMEDSVYGPLQYKGKMKYDEYTGKCEAFYLNGQTAFKGDVSSGIFNGDGRLYSKKGKLIYKGKFKDGYPEDGDQLDTIMDAILEAAQNESSDGYSDEIDFYNSLYFY